MQFNRVFTDGASRGNPGRGGWGAIIESHGYVVELGGREDHTTNNRMELLAVIQALRYLKERDRNHLDSIIFTDSSYVLKGSTLWLSGWKSNGWKTKTKKDVLNSDLWRELDKMLGPKIKWELLPGHSEIPGNERCDEIATAYADNMPVNLFSGSVKNYPLDLSITVSSVKKQSAQEKKSSAKAYSYVSFVNGIVRVHSTWAECENYVKGVSGARFKKVFSEQEEASLIDQWKKL